MTSTCQYCASELEDTSKSTCDWCNTIIQEANCQGIYLADAAKAVAKRDDLTSPDTRREAIQEKFVAYGGK